ncbi:hypothetical protein DFH09DRAFT_1336190 [Mycena vulgaris]|nr:hypothetical protein DFH09DRAFT_1336190 [Mycena vulgaris]
MYFQSYKKPQAYLGEKGSRYIAAESAHIADLLPPIVSPVAQAQHAAQHRFPPPPLPDSAPPFRAPQLRRIGKRRRGTLIPSCWSLYLVSTPPARSAASVPTPAASRLRAALLRHLSSGALAGYNWVPLYLPAGVFISSLTPLHAAHRQFPPPPLPASAPPLRAPPAPAHWQGTTRYLFTSLLASISRLYTPARRAASVPTLAASRLRAALLRHLSSGALAGYNCVPLHLPPGAPISSLSSLHAAQRRFPPPAASRLSAALLRAVRHHSGRTPTVRLPAGRAAQ